MERITRKIKPPKVANIGSFTSGEAALVETVDGMEVAGTSCVLVTVSVNGGARVTGSVTAVLVPRIKPPVIWSVPDTVEAPDGSRSCLCRIRECIAIGQTVRELQLEICRMEWHLRYSKRF